MTTAADIQEALARYLGDEIACQAVNGTGERVECLTPLDYPSGDGISVWVETHAAQLVVTDYGEALADLLARPAQDHKALRDQVQAISDPLGVAFREGRLQASAELGDVADAIWRVATAASRVAQVSVTFGPKRRQHPESEFADEITTVLTGRNVHVERESHVVGASGHKHRATIYLPAREAVLEPILGHWNQVYAVYAKFGDLSRANGFALYSLLDDRAKRPADEAARMLVQVSKVVEWTRHDEWLTPLAS